MFRYLTPLIFIGLSITIFSFFTDDIYKNIQELRLEQDTYDVAFANSKALENERDNLTSTYSKIPVENLERIRKFLPDNVDNIRLILELDETLAAPYGMALKDVQYSVVPKEKEDGGGPNGPITNTVNGKGKTANKSYGSWDLGFSVTGSYNNFLNFLRDLESNLRIVDISSIQFSSTPVNASGSSLSDVYKYTFNIKTYWLKN